VLEKGALEGHSEKLMRERDSLRHSWSGGCTTIDSVAWYRGDDFVQTGAARIATPPNYPFKPHYPHPLTAPLHAGETKVLARQALCRFELSGLLRDDPASKGIMPALEQTFSPRAASHMYHVLSCVAAEDKQRMLQGSWGGLQPFMKGKSDLNPDTGKLINSSMALAESTVRSNSRASVVDTDMWLKAQMARSWDATSVPGPTAHPFNCCCLTCSLCLRGEFPKTRSLYQRLCTHEAGNAQNFARTGQDLPTTRHSLGEVQQGKVCRPQQAEAGPRHPQVPHGYQSSPRKARVASSWMTEPHLTRIPLATAIRGGLAHSLRFASTVEGLVD